MLDWPSISPIQQDQSTTNRLSVSGIPSPDISTRSQAGTEVTSTPSYKTPTRRLLQSPPGKSVVPPSPQPPYYDVAALLQQSWRKAIRVLRANPSLMTRSILCRALRQRPPTYVVDWMLRLNPCALTLATNAGPSPLYVAIQENCSTAVVESILRACPKYLIEYPPGSRWDPVALAKRVRGEEKDLLDLLHRPVSYWKRESENSRVRVTSRNNDKIAQLGAHKRKPTIIPEVATPDKELEEIRRQLVSTAMYSSQASGRPTPPVLVTPEATTRHHIPSILHRTRPLGTTPPPERSHQQQSTFSPCKPPSRLNSVERQELDNMKYLVLSLLKAHRRLLNQEGNSSAVAHMDEAEREALIRIMEKKQQEQSRICLIALDMKEKAIRALARRIENRISSTGDSQLTTQLRSSYMHLYGRFLGLEEELHRLKDQTVGSAPPEATMQSRLPEQVHLVDNAETEVGGTAVSVGSVLTDESSGECSRTCLRPPWQRFRSRHTAPY